MRRADRRGRRVQIKIAQQRVQIIATISQIWSRSGGRGGRSGLRRGRIKIGGQQGVQIVSKSLFPRLRCGGRQIMRIRHGFGLRPGRGTASGVEQIVHSAVQIRGSGLLRGLHMPLTRLRRNIQRAEQFVHIPHARHVEFLIGVNLVARRGGLLWRQKFLRIVVMGFHLGQQGVDFLLVLPGRILIKALHGGTRFLFDLFRRGSGRDRAALVYQLGEVDDFFINLGEIDDLFISLGNLLGNHANLMGLTERVSASCGVRNNFSRNDKRHISL